MRFLCWQGKSALDHKVNILFVVLVIILGLAVIGLVIFIVNYLKKPRKSKAFELDDDNFDYSPSKWSIVDK